MFEISLSFNLNLYELIKINKYFFNKEVNARQGNQITTLEKPKEPDFKANLNYFYLEDEIDVKEDLSTELQICSNAMKC